MTYNNEPPTGFDHEPQWEKPRGLSCSTYFVLALVLTVGLAVGTWLAWSQQHGTGLASFNPVALLTGDPFEHRKELTLLLVGKDQGKDTDIPRTDTILLALLNLETERAALVSVPRDTRVDIPGYGIGKINSAYVHGGIELTRRTLQNFLGVPIDYAAQVSLEGFKSLVDAAGGVEINVDKRMKYTDTWGGLFIDLYPGKQTLDGEHAMQYVRFRHDAEGDIGRMRRQQEFMKALLLKLKAPSNAYRLPLVVRALYKMIETDLSMNQALALGRRVKGFASNGLLTDTLPGVPQTIGGVSYMILDGATGGQKIWELRNQLAGVATPDTVQVLNGTGKAGFAGQVSEALGVYGLQLAEPGNAPTGFDNSETIILYKPEALATAKRVREVLGVGALREADQPEGADPAAGVVVIVGADLQDRL